MTDIQIDSYSKSFLQLDIEFKCITKEIVMLYEAYLAGEYSPTEYDIVFQELLEEMRIIQQNIVTLTA